MDRASIGRKCYTSSAVPASAYKSLAMPACTMTRPIRFRSASMTSTHRRCFMNVTRAPSRVYRLSSPIAGHWMLLTSDTYRDQVMYSSSICRHTLRRFASGDSAAVLFASHIANMFPPFLVVKTTCSTLRESPQVASVRTISELPHALQVRIAPLAPCAGRVGSYAAIQCLEEIMLPDPRVYACFAIADSLKTRANPRQVIMHESIFERLRSRELPFGIRAAFAAIRMAHARFDVSFVRCALHYRAPANGRSTQRPSGHVWPSE